MAQQSNLDRLLQTVGLYENYYRFNVRRIAEINEKNTYPGLFQGIRDLEGVNGYNRKQAEMTLENIKLIISKELKSNEDREKLQQLNENTNTYQRINKEWKKYI